MATATSTESSTDSHDDHGHHPTERDYVKIAAILGVFTAAEISTFYVDFGPATVPLLVVLMIIKFAMVAGEFMHLKYDTRVYTRFMGAGLVLAALIYTAVLITFSNVVR